MQGRASPYQRPSLSLFSTNNAMTLFILLVPICHHVSSSHLSSQTFLFYTFLHVHTTPHTFTFYTHTFGFHLFLACTHLFTPYLFAHILHPCYHYLVWRRCLAPHTHASNIFMRRNCLPAYASYLSLREGGFAPFASHAHFTFDILQGEWRELFAFLFLHGRGRSGRRRWRLAFLAGSLLF